MGKKPQVPALDWMVYMPGNRGATGNTLNQLTPRESYVLSGYRAEVLRNLSLYGEIELSIRVQNEFPRYSASRGLKAYRNAIAR